MKKKIMLFLQFVLISIFALVGIFEVEHISIILYILLIVLFLALMSLGLWRVLYGESGICLYILSALLFLGFPFKFTMHEIFNSSYIEPVGHFMHTQREYTEVIVIAICGAIGLILCQLLMIMYVKKEEQKAVNLDDCKVSYIYPLVIITSVILMSILNLKYNIMLFGMTPDLLLPFKGNTVFFLILTRFLPLLAIYTFLFKFTNKWIILGTLVFLICSIGVLSRMVIIIYFVFIIVIFIKYYVNTTQKQPFQKIALLVIMFITSTYLTVSLSTKLRYVFNENMTRNTKILEDEFKDKESRPVFQYKEANSKSSSLFEKIEEASKIGTIKSTIYTYQSLAVERWIGMEGVMAVVAYPNKGFDLMIDAFKENGFKSDGKSFFNTIADLKLMKEMETIKNPRNISTTVPGPFAFFYYSGSKIFVVFAMLIAGLLISRIEIFFNKLFFQRQAVSMYISVFMAFDFYQFGISPMAFAKYWIFSFFCIIATKFVLKKGRIELFIQTITKVSKSNS